MQDLDFDSKISLNFLPFLNRFSKILISYFCWNRQGYVNKWRTKKILAFQTSYFYYLIIVDYFYILSVLIRIGSFTFFIFFKMQLPLCCVGWYFAKNINLVIYLGFVELTYRATGHLSKITWSNLVLSWIICSLHSSRPEVSPPSVLKESSLIVSTVKEVLELLKFYFIAFCTLLEERGVLGGGGGTVIYFSCGIFIRFHVGFLSDFDQYIRKGASFSIINIFLYSYIFFIVDELLPLNILRV